MSEWKEVLLTEITTKIGDGLHGTPVYENRGEYYFINGNNLINGKIIIKEDTKRVNETEYLKHAKPLNQRTLLLGINGTIGNVAYYKSEKCMLGKSACYINLNHEVDLSFVYYTFIGKDFQNYIEGIATGTTIPNVPLKGIREYSFKLPPLPEQTAIASILSSLDDKIDLLHRQNATLEKMAETLFRQWFVEEAKEENVKLGDFVSNIRENAKLEDLKSFENYVGLEHIPRRQISLTTWGKPDLLASNKSIFKENDILFGKLRSYFHKVVFAPVNGICSTDILVIRPKKEEWFAFSLFWFFTKEVVEYSDLGSGGTRMPRTNWEILKNYLIPKPDLKNIIDFNEIVIVKIQKIKSNQTQIRTLTTLRDTLLPKLMSGELRVKM
jgi:type I restriction enzyme, S subunit